VTAEGTERGSPWQGPHSPGAAAAFAPSHRRTLHPTPRTRRPAPSPLPPTLGKSLGVLRFIFGFQIYAGSVPRCFQFAGFLV